MKITFTKQLPKPSSATKKTVKNAQCLVVLVNDKKSILASDVLGEQTKRVEQLISASGFNGSVGETVVDLGLTSNDLQLQLVGIGKAEKLNASNLQKVAKAIYSATQKRVANITIALSNAFDTEQFYQLTLALLNATYRFDKYKSETKKPNLAKVALLTTEDYASELAFAQATHTGQNLTRNVANEPGNVCHPEYMAEQALSLAETYPDLLRVTVIDQKKMAKLGMNCFLSVSIGSDREGKLVLLEYFGKSKLGKGKKAQTTLSSPIALVGKGVTFDSGGISLKPGAGMEDMKYDMGGAASVIGTVKALCEARLPIDVVSALACAENMPSARASRPGDIVKSMNGQTVEIINTDAEGRLVLCDTLTYVQKYYNPEIIIDVATLTGACLVALGSVRSAVYSEDEDLLFALENASEQAGDAVWHMPMDEEYNTLINSPCADMQNIGGRFAGSITAACFLSRFIDEGQAWAHLDIAGVAWISGANKCATGRPVPLFMQYLKNCASAK